MTASLYNGWVGEQFTCFNLAEMPIVSSAESSDIRSDAIEIVNALPDGATWDDLMYKIYVRQCIEAGISDAEAGRVLDVAEVRQRFGLNP